MKRRTAEPADDWGAALDLACRVRFRLQIPGFTVGDLLNLKPGALLTTGQPEGADVEVELNGHAIGWARMEPAGEKVAFRLTRLAQGTMA